jgi:hypothetical protein
VIQTEGQDATFMAEAKANSTVLRYVGINKKLSLKYRIIFFVRKYQYALLNFSYYRPVGLVARLLADSRFADRAIRAIAQVSEQESSNLSRETNDIGTGARQVITQIPEDWSLIGLKTIIAFRHVLENYEFDYLFRTNTSSYVDVPKLKSFLEGKPAKNLYAGVIGKVFGNLEFASGAGILLSRDVVERICEKENDWKHGLVDDVAIGDLVSRLQSPSVEISELPRLDLATLAQAESATSEQILENFHFRCKSTSATETIQIMKHIHTVKAANI